MGGQGRREVLGCWLVEAALAEPTCSLDKDEIKKKEENKLRRQGRKQSASAALTISTTISMSMH